jgi:NTE family protein
VRNEKKETREYLTNSSASLEENKRVKLNTDTDNSDTVENVLVLQGGGSLGAFGCGVFKAISNYNIRLDITAGTSIGGINAAIIAGSKDEEHPEKLLERFWLELSESFVDVDHIFSPPSDFIPYKKNSHSKNYDMKLRQVRSFYSSAIFGNDKMFRPRWRQETAFSDPEFLTPQNWTYLYDHTPLVNTLENYIDYDKLRPNGNPNSRLILTAVNVLNAEPLTFDSAREQITPKHILATSAYPLYNFKWVEVEKGVYCWDGGLLSNTPLREVIDASPVNDKRIFLVENYPKKVDSLPRSIPEVHHRARDIMFSDKTKHNIAMSRVITMYLKYIDELYKIIEDHVDLSNIDQAKLKKMHHKYKKIKREHGTEIKDILYITRDEPYPHIYENADFSPQAIKASIKEGEIKTAEILNRKMGPQYFKNVV